MHSTDRSENREVQFAEIAKSQTDKAALKDHLKEITEGKACKGRARSLRCLEYIVDQAMAGHFEALKERVIGVELFGRSPSYETGEDSIVRVAAGDVRKRLMQHYSIYEAESEFRLSLPTGSYILEVIRRPQVDKNVPSIAKTKEMSAGPLLQSSGLASEQTPPVSAQSDSTSRSPESVRPNALANSSSLTWRSLVYFALLLAVACVAEWAVLRSHYSLHARQRVSTLPWSAFFASPHSTVLILSDPNIAEIQLLTGLTVSTSAYANHRYIPEPNKLTPEELRLSKQFLIGDKTASVATPIALIIAQLAQPASKKIETRAAREVELSDLHTDNNFILLGSPGSNPWVGLFNNQLDFKFGVGVNPGLDTVVINSHPRGSELTEYVPSAPGSAPGQSVAIVAFVQNPEQSGPVLILDGSSREGTEAAGKFVVDLPRLSKAMQSCGINPAGPLQHFEMLLRVNIMAGLPNSSDVIACHQLPRASS